MFCVNSDGRDLCSCPCVRDLLLPLTRIMGVMTAVVLFGVGFDVTFHHYEGGVCVMLGAVLVFLLETLWVVTNFLRVCTHRGSPNPCWDGFVTATGWPRCISYSVAAGILILHPHRLWLYSVAGTMLLLLVVCHGLLGAMNSGRDARTDVKATLLPGDDVTSCSEDGEVAGYHNVVDTGDHQV